MSDPGALAVALGHVRNAAWQLMSNGQPDRLRLGLQCLDLEALLNPNDLEPAVVDVEASPAASLLRARRLLETTPEWVAPAAWPLLAVLTARLG